MPSRLTVHCLRLAHMHRASPRALSARAIFTPVLSRAVGCKLLGLAIKILQKKHDKEHRKKSASPHTSQPLHRARTNITRRNVPQRGFHSVYERFSPAVSFGTSLSGFCYNIMQPPLGHCSSPVNMRSCASALTRCPPRRRPRPRARRRKILPGCSAAEAPQARLALQDRGREAQVQAAQEDR